MSRSVNLTDSLYFILIKPLNQMIILSNLLNLYNIFDKEKMLHHNQILKKRHLGRLSDVKVKNHVKFYLNFLNSLQLK